MAERTKFSMYVIYSAFISLFIYPIEGHWTWGGGWLCNSAADSFMMTTFGDVFHDFAGSAIVHSVGGVLALVGALALGPRIGKYDADRKSRAIPGHSLTLAALGVFILWMGWFGFNPGSQARCQRGGQPRRHLACVPDNQSGCCGRWNSHDVCHLAEIW